MKFNLKTFSNILFYSGIAVTLYTIYTIYVTPVIIENSCPVYQNKSLIYLSIGILSVWFILSFFQKED